MALPARDSYPQTNRYPGLHAAPRSRSTDYIPKHMTEPMGPESWKKLSPMTRAIARAAVGSVVVLGAVHLFTEATAPPAVPDPSKEMSDRAMPGREVVMQAEEGDSYSRMAAEAGVPANQVPGVADQMSDHYGAVVNIDGYYEVPVPKPAQPAAAPNTTLQAGQ